jgi:hypothetical protein
MAAPDKLPLYCRQQIVSLIDGINRVFDSNGLFVLTCHADSSLLLQDKPGIFFKASPNFG